MKPEDEQYFERIEDRLDQAIDRAERARSQGRDPQTEIEIPVARDMADRVENILGIPGVAERVRELEEEMSREEAALELVEDFVDGSVGDYDSREGKVEGAVRTAVALLTEGVVAAPIEGIDRAELLQNDDGTEFINVYYAGPIRSAGGTAQALSVLVADYARALLGIEEFHARSDEVERYAEEVALYEKETGLQYTPKDKETKFIAEHLPIMLDGEAAGDEEVSGFRDLERVDTNSARGGMCLVLAEGIALKAPKIQRYTRQLDEVDWPWLQDLIDGTYDDAAADEGEAGDEDDPAGVEGHEEGAEPGDSEGPVRAEPVSKFLRDLIAGRPVFGHPSESGGFRLRYGRSRNHGFATAGVHPATMHLVDDFLATGTQIKTERPGKAAGVVPVDSIEGPTVRLANGDVRRINDPAEALEIRNGVDEILDLGEYLVNYGEFIENNHPLVPASYAVEWWEQEFADAGADVQALRDDPLVDVEHPDAETALSWVDEYDCPIHPEYTYLWHDVTVTEYDALATAAADGHREDDELILERTPDVTRALERLLIEHTQTEDEIRVPEHRALLRSLGVTEDLEREWRPADLSQRARAWGADDGVETSEGAVADGGVAVPDDAVEHGSTGNQTESDSAVEHSSSSRPSADDTAEEADAAEVAETVEDSPAVTLPGTNAIKAVNEVTSFKVRERAPTRIGNRMGRPEKSESRDLSPAVHTMFPIGEAGGSQRDVAKAAKDRTDAGRGVIEVSLGDRKCPDCEEHTYRNQCPDCGGHTEPHYECDDCGIVVEPDESGRVECPRCEWEVESPERQTIDLNSEFHEAMESIGEREGSFSILKGVKGLMSANETPEPMQKGVLRAKHGVSSFKDGTVRYDMTDLPVTSVRPEELDTTAEQFRGLGYETDIDGEPLRHDDQLIELKVQDIVLPDGAAEHMIRTADFVDDLLERFYGLDPFYEVEDREELVGELVFGMAPHTSAAVVGRVVGFTSAAVGYAHPYFHAAKRRNCFHPDTKLWFRDESDSWHHDDIRTFVEKRLDEDTADSDDFGTLVQELDGDVFVPSIDDGGNEVVKPIEAVSKHPASEHMVRVETRSGREITVTPDHELCRWTDGVDSVTVTELETGDEIPIPATGSDKQPTSVHSDTELVTVADGGAPETDAVASIEYVASDLAHTYCLTVAETHTLVANDMYSAQCDGDEDCVMLLLDGLLNFSKEFLPDQRGGKMDAPLVMSSRIDPSEIDDEAHNMDIVRQYPAEFYEATLTMEDPEAVEDLVQIGEDTLDTDEEYHGFDHTHDTSDIALGPALSAYKTLGDMETKMDAQLELSRKLRAVDETDVAERVIENHFLPDLIGNLRAFSRQETRCLDCGEKYRRMPLTGDCRECGGRMTLTVHEGSVNKYMDIAIRVAEEFGCRDYTKQRLEVLEHSLESVFVNDKNKQSGIADFM
jgi:DNA polymerase II large subunit